MKITFFKGLSIISILAEKITEANKDGIITIQELIDISVTICKEFGLKIDDTGIKNLKL